MQKKNQPDIELIYHLLLEQSQEIIILFDKQGNINTCNKTAKIELGYREDIYQVSVSDIFHNAFKFENNQPEIMKKFKDKVYETVAYRKNQTCFVVDLKITIIESNKNFIGICTATNRTDKYEIKRELKSVVRELKGAKRIKNEFLANITHELRTPVNGIMGLTENLLETELLPRQIETLNIIHRCCLNMTNIINNILDFTKIANGKLILEKREFDFRRFIDQTTAFNANMMNEKGLKLYVNISDNVPIRVIGDEHRITQVLNNLFSNAIKFTAVGQIALEVVKTAQSNTEVELFFVLMDTGIGISPEEKDKLFQSFSQVDGSITRRFGGTGLGLAICKQLIELMGGTISVDSEKSKGSTFSFTVRLEIPLGQEDTVVDYLGSNDIRREEEVVRTLHGDDSSNPDNDYIGKILGQANIYTQNKDKLRFYMDSNTQNEMKEVWNNINITTEKLAICIEMENWNKAESLVEYIKNIIPKENDNKLLSRKILSLILSVRKEDHDKSLAILNELKAMFREES